METAWNSLDKEINGQPYASISTDSRHFIAMVNKLKKKYPDEVIIKAEPKTNDGCLYAWLPLDWLTIQKPRKLNLSEEERERRRKLIAERNSVNTRVSTEMDDENLPFTDELEEFIPEEDDELI